MTRGHPVLCGLFRGNDKPSSEGAKGGRKGSPSTRQEMPAGILPIRRYDT